MTHQPFPDPDPAPTLPAFVPNSPLTAEQLHAIAAHYISERYPYQLEIFRQRYPHPPGTADQAHELGFTCGLLLGLDIASHLHGAGTVTDSPHPATIPAAQALFNLAN